MIRTDCPDRTSNCAAISRIAGAKLLATAIEIEVAVALEGSMPNRKNAAARAIRVVERIMNNFCLQISSAIPYVGQTVIDQPAFLHVKRFIFTSQTHLPGYTHIHYVCI